MYFIDLHKRKVKRFWYGMYSYREWVSGKREKERAVEEEDGKVQNV